MRIIDRYIVHPFIKTFILSLLGFLLLYIFIHILTNLEEILNTKPSWQLMVRYYLSFLPYISIQTVPIASLLGTLFSLGILNRHNELIPLRTAGLSIWRLTMPLLCLGLVITLVVFIVEDYLLPQSQLETAELEQELFRTKENRSPEEMDSIALYGTGNKLYFIKRFNPKKGTAEDITILEHDENQNVISKTVAQNGYYKDGWVFRKCAVYFFDNQNRLNGEPQYYEEKRMDIPETPRDFLAQRSQIEFMSIKNLKRYIKKLPTSGARTAIRNLKIQLYQRYAFPLTSLVVILVGIPFGIKVQRRSAGLASFGICLGISFAYFILVAVSLAMGRAGFIHPLASAWLGHLVFILISLILIRQIP